VNGVADTRSDGELGVHAFCVVEAREDVEGRKKEAQEQ